MGGMSPAVQLDAITNKSCSLNKFQSAQNHKMIKKAVHIVTHQLKDLSISCLICIEGWSSVTVTDLSNI